jgi:hypothetical protein
MQIMSISLNKINEKGQGAAVNKAPGGLRGVAGLLTSIAVILVFMFFLGPALEQGSWIKPMADFIEERNIESNMYFYTEVEEFSDARLNWQHSMSYAPRAFAGQ